MSSVKPVQAAPHSVESEVSGRHLATPLPDAPVRDAVEVARAARKRRAQRILSMMALWVGLPTLLGVFYFGAIAGDQYESFATFMVPTQRTVMLTEYLRSRDLLARLEQGGFSKHYTSTEDPVVALEPDAGSEQRYRSFQRVVEVRNGEAGIMRLRVRAFSAASAQKFSSQIITLGREFMAAHSEVKLDHLLVISKPSLASESTYPRRLYGVLATFLVSLALFAVGSLLIAAAREHAQF